MKKNIIYDYSKRENSVVYLKDGFNYLHLKKFDKLNYKVETKYQVYKFIMKYTNKERKEKTQEIYKNEIHKKELKEILEVLKDVNYPVFVNTESSTFYFNKSDYVIYEGSFSFYTYRRNIILKKINKLQKKIDVLKSSQMNLKNGWIDKLISIYYRHEIKEKESQLNILVEKELINYISDIRNEFDLLRLPKELFDELKTHIQLSGKNQIEKTTIILDDILEKFFRLHYLGKTTDVINGYDLLIKSSHDELVKYIQSKIALLKDYNSSENVSDKMELNEEEILAIDKLKQELFNEQ